MQKSLPEKVGRLRKKYPEVDVELWAQDEHRLGLKPVSKKVWALRGERPVVEVHHRYKWTYLYSFVRPTT